MQSFVRDGLTTPRLAVITTGLALISIVVVAGLVRMIGIDSGRPFAYHPDEWIIFNSALTMVHERDWNPHNFLYPSLLIEVQAAVTAAIRLFGGASLETGQGWVFGTELQPVQFGYLLAGREIVMGLGLATVAVVFAIGRQLRGSAAGLAAAALLATMPLHITDSRHLTTDVPVALFCAVTLLMTVKASADGRDRWWLLAGAAAGLAASMKWSGAVVFGVPMLAYFLAANDVEGILVRLRQRTPYLMGLAAVLAFVVTTPAVILDSSAVLESFRYQAQVYSTTRRGMPSDSLMLNLRGLAAGLGPVAALVAAAGLARLLVRPRRRVELTIPAFVAVILIVVTLPPRQFDRNLLPILPFLAVAAGCLLVDVPAAVRRRAERRGGTGPNLALRRAAVPTTVLALVVCLVQGGGAGIESGERAQAVDTRTIARDWLLVNIGRNTAIARERDTPILTPAEYRLRPRYYLASRSLDWYRGSGTQIMVTSSYAYGQFLKNPSTPEEDAWYQALFTLPEIFSVEPGPDRPGPTIRIYELAPFTQVAGASG